MAEWPGLPAGYDLPLVNSSTKRLPDPTMDAIEEALIPTIEDTPHTYTEPQTFDPADAFRIGDVLRAKLTDGYAGQRLHLTGATPGVMPYIEVVPTTKTGTDVGGSVAGIQVYNTLFGGQQGVPEREFIALEAKGDLYPDGRMFRLGTWASGGGSFLPFRIGIGDINVVDFTADGVQGGASSTRAQIELRSKTRIYSLGSTIDNMIDFQRGSSFKALRAVTAFSGAAQGPKIFLGRTRGSIGVPENLQTDDRIGGIEFGSYGTGAQVGDATEAAVAWIRAEATQAYSDWANQRGARLIFSVAEQGTTSVQEVLRLAVPTTDTHTGVLLMVNKAGVKSLTRVLIGAADSGGTGFRMLRVAN